MDKKFEINESSDRRGYYRVTIYHGEYSMGILLSKSELYQLLNKVNDTIDDLESRSEHKVD